MKRLRHAWTDARGIETVQWVAWGGVLLILIAVVYGVFNGNAQLRAAIRSTTAFLAVRFGSDLSARGPRATVPCLLDDPVTPQPCDTPVLAVSPSVRAVVLDPPTVSAAVITPLGRTVIRPAAGVPAVVEPSTGRIRLIDAPRQRMILIDPVQWEAVAIDLATGVATPLPVAALIAQGLIEVQPLDAPAIAPLGLATLGVPRALPDHLALAAAFAAVVGLLGLASRGVPYGMPASAAAGASVPPWLAALGQVLLGVVISLLALVALAALVFVGAKLLAAVGIGAGLSFFAALIIAGVVLAVRFVILEIRARWEEYAAQHGDPDFWTALQIVGVSLLSLTGIPQLIEARRGARLVSDAPLTETERWVLGLGGLVQVVVFLRGVRAGLRSLGRRGAPRVADPDGPGAGAPRPAAREPAGGGPGNGGLARPTDPDGPGAGAPRVADPDGPGAGAPRPAASGSTGGGPGNGGAPPVDADGPGAGAPRVADTEGPGAGSVATSEGIGLNREAYVARLVGGRVARERVVVRGLGSTDIDVIGPAGELITVGGPAKVRLLSKWGMHLQRLKAVGKERNVQVMAYLEEGTPDEAIRLAKKWLGDENVVLFKWHEQP